MPSLAIKYVPVRCINNNNNMHADRSLVSIQTSGSERRDVQERHWYRPPQCARVYNIQHILCVHTVKLTIYTYWCLMFMNIGLLSYLYTYGLCLPINIDIWRQSEGNGDGRERQRVLLFDARLTRGWFFSGNATPYSKREDNAIFLSIGKSRTRRPWQPCSRSAYDFDRLDGRGSCAKKSFRKYHSCRKLINKKLSGQQHKTVWRPLRRDKNSKRSKVNDIHVSNAGQ